MIAKDPDPQSCGPFPDADPKGKALDNHWWRHERHWTEKPMESANQE
jgi:hypothetical protein